MRTPCFALAFFAVAAAAAVPAHAALFMHFAGITGNVTTPLYQGDILLDTFSIGASRTITTPTGAGSTRESSPPSFSDASISSAATAASIALFTQSLIGKPATVNLYLSEISRGANVTYAEWDFTDALISSFFTSTASGNTPEDFYTLNFSTVTYTWFNIDPSSGTVSGSETVTFDLTQGQVTSSAVGDTAGFSFATSSVDATPEPASASLFVLAAPLFLKRRR
jgi:type VI protein secretion system component Hcp